MRKSKITFNEKMGWWKGDLFANDIIDLAISKAYRDLMRTIRGFANNPNHDVIIKNARYSLKKSICNILNSNIENQVDFDSMHKDSCFNLISSFDNQIFTIGQAQKWINMTFKYLHLLDYNDVSKIYEYCHVPIDSYILNATSYQMNVSWSKINNYEEYLNFQDWFRKKYADDIPLDKEFYLWLEEVNNMKNK